MTCIAAFRTDKGCYMAADSRISSMGEGSWYGQVAFSKIKEQTICNGFRDLQRILYGCRGSTAFVTIIDCIDWANSEYMEVKDYIIRQILPRIRKGMEEAKFDAEKLNGEVMICIGTTIITIDKYLSAVFHDEQFMAIGDGESAAYGAYDMLDRFLGTPKTGQEVENALISVLQTVAKRNWSCDDRITVMKNFEDAPEETKGDRKEMRGS